MGLPPEVEAGCRNARLLARVCDVLLGDELVERPDRFGRYDGDLPGEYDPDVDPFFWELD